VTDEPETWHRENLERNPAHYSALLRWLAGGGGALARLQTQVGARIFFNTLVPFEDGLIKYGVISTSDLINDLLGEAFYLSTFRYNYRYLPSKLFNKMQTNSC
jgi:translocator assembly and maintenance protein 41